jgi:DNA-binding NarL/FixJ family response regulator
MLTVYEDDENIFKSICAGASGYLVKRLSGGKILEAIRDTLSGGAPMNAPIARKVLDMFRGWDNELAILIV